MEIHTLRNLFGALLIATAHFEKPSYIWPYFKIISLVPICVLILQ